ncbi:hypothetical protein F5Y04DRAFT_193842 [Hypomontagnella monticulosa]|nr:hypothetical protein F5Y04DRAFT_193842 [Hypomontagnella monticulosa]
MSSQQTSRQGSNGATRGPELGHVCHALPALRYDGKYMLCAPLYCDNCRPSPTPSSRRTVSRREGSRYQSLLESLDRLIALLERMRRHMSLMSSKLRLGLMDVRVMRKGYETGRRPPFRTVVPRIPIFNEPPLSSPPIAIPEVFEDADSPSPIEDEEYEAVERTVSHVEELWEEMWEIVDIQLGEVIELPEFEDSDSDKDGDDTSDLAELSDSWTVL